MKYANGDIYEGKWKDDKIVGLGIMTFADGNILKITKKAQRPSEFDSGIMIYTNGDILEGKWTNNHPIGKLKLVYNNGDVYEGSINNNQRFGIGKLTYDNGDVYEGRFENNIKNGKGTLTLKNSIIKSISGIWRNDMMPNNPTYIYDEKKLNDHLRVKELLHILKYTPKDVPNKSAPFIGSKYRKTKKSYIKRENTRKRCPNGSRKNYKTKVCEKKSAF
uniref:MORN repeat protein n=1 Tax=viral metagenome TaxID=1070528 RepID=A0A6C0JZE4_9ZZZZ